MEEQKAPEPCYLFVSKDCTHCRDLFNLINTKSELAKLVQVVQIETLRQIPPEVTKVPTIINAGKAMSGNQCFEWVEKYGVIEAATGFGSSDYSFLDSQGSETPGTGIYSFLGDQDGTNDINTMEIDNKYKQEQGQKAGSSNLDELKKQRMMEVPNQQQQFMRNI